MNAEFYEATKPGLKPEREEGMVQTWLRTNPRIIPSFFIALLIS